MPATTTHRRLSPFALLLALLVIPSCAGTYPPDGGGTSGDILLEDLNPKLLPIAIEDDGNTKDVIYKSRVNYKPKTALANGKTDKRLMLKAKQDDASLRAFLEPDLFATQSTIHARVGFDPAKVDGLVDGTSLAFLELVLDASPPVDGDSSIRTLEAVYDAASGGLLVRATDGLGPLGKPILFDGASEVVLQFRDTGATLFLEAGTPTGDFYFNFNTQVVHSEALIADGIQPPRSVAWGVDGLDKKGTFFLNQLLLAGTFPAIGATETAIVQTLIGSFDESFHASPIFAFDLQTATDDVDLARAALVTAIADIEAALGAADGGGGFDEVTQGELALKSANKALKLAEKTVAQGNKLLDKGKTNVLPVAKKALKIAQFTQLAIAQMAGFRSKSKNKVEKMGSVISW